MTEERRNYDASFCSKIPLHQTNQIQPHGALLVVDKARLELIQASANAGELFGKEINDLVGQSLSALLEEACFREIEANRDQYQYALPGELRILTGADVQRRMAMIHEKNGCLMIEVELPDYFGDPDSYDSFFIRLQQIMSAVNNCGSVNEVAAVAAKEIKRLTGFDKVMIYCFDDEWVGEVIAEEMEPGMDPYLGLRFPASDVPRQARELYFKNPYRIIPNRDYQAVPLVPETNTLTRQPTDLSDCKFRSVLAVHLEYLRNMNVVASMSTRLIHKEQLWGLIACHHRQAKYLSFRQCAFFEFLSNIISSKIASLLYREAQQKEVELHSHFTDIMRQLEFSGSMPDAFDLVKDQLLLVLGADGVALCWDDEIYTNGIAPENDRIRQLRDWLMEQSVTGTRHYQALPYHYDAAKHFSETASGLLALPIQPYQGNFILAFRAEVVKKVAWGGDPRNPVSFDNKTSNYHPRNSFSVWQETVRHTAEPWLKVELDIAEKLRIAVVEFTLLRLTSREG